LCGRGGCALKVSNKQIFFTLWDSHQIYRYQTETKKLSIFGTKFKTWRGGSGPNEFDHPRGLTVAEKKIFICDSNNHRIQILDKETGSYISSWGKEGTDPGELYFPEGIFLYDELLYIGDNEHVQVFTKVGHFIQRIGITDNNDNVNSKNNIKLKIGSRDGEFKHAIGLCVVKNKLYVADNGNHRIQMFT